MNKLDRAYIFRIADKVMEQAQHGTVYIGYWKYCVKLDLNKLRYNGQPLDIGDKRFLNEIENYLSLAREFYISDKDYYELNDESFDEKLFLDLFVNMTNFDVENIEKYLKQRTQMLLDKNNYLLEPMVIGKIEGGDVEISILRNNSNLEAPLRFRTICKNDEEMFFLPDITFGAVDDCLHIYAIQGKRDKQDNRTAKKLGRYLMKLGKGVDMGDEILSNVTASALASLTIFMSYFKQKNMQDVKAYGFTPVRYDSKVATASMRMREEELNMFLEKNDEIQSNITNKFYHTILRYAHHFNQKAEYDEFHECLDMKLEENKVDINTLNSQDRNIIYNLDELVANGLSVNKQL